MKYIQQEDYEYIIKKYHDENAVQSSLDGVHRGAHIFNRFIRRDDIFDESTDIIFWQSGLSKCKIVTIRDPLARSGKKWYFIHFGKGRMRETRAY